MYSLIILGINSFIFKNMVDLSSSVVSSVDYRYEEILKNWNGSY